MLCVCLRCGFCRATSISYERTNELVTGAVGTRQTLLHVSTSTLDFFEAPHQPVVVSCLLACWYNSALRLYEVLLSKYSVVSFCLPIFSFHDNRIINNKKYFLVKLGTPYRVYNTTAVTAVQQHFEEVHTNYGVCKYIAQQNIYHSIVLDWYRPRIPWHQFFRVCFLSLFLSLSC